MTMVLLLHCTQSERFLLFLRSSSYRRKAAIESFTCFVTVTFANCDILVTDP